MNSSRLIKLVLIAVVVIAALVLAAKLISGAVGIITSAFNAILGLVIVIALIIIVCWMFGYARKNK